MTNKKARVIAFYLPQYHPIPENDRWWGKGFTEWTNVGKAKPLFKGHYQPRVPADLGYYDLRVPEVREAQAEMARNVGIEGFMYWHYWFGNGKTLLEMPFQEVLKTGKPDFPFCLGWANHSWENKTWDASSQNKNKILLIEQLYTGKEDYINHFHYVLRAFQDKRYMTIDGKPMFYIFDPIGFKDCTMFIDIWQDLAIKNDLKGIHFIGRTNNRLTDKAEILKIGFDAVNINTVYLAESKIKGKLLYRINSGINYNTKLSIMQKFKYSEVIKHLLCQFDSEENVYPMAIPQYDHSPRRNKSGFLCYGSTPELFRKHLLEVLSVVITKKKEHRIIFLKSWNEWAECNYVEPDLVFGHGYLDVLKEEIFSS